MNLVHVAVVKYKKCCIPKYDKTIAPLISHKKPTYSANPELNSSSWSSYLWINDLEPMSDQEILNELNKLGIPMTKEQFLQDIIDKYDLDPVVHLWEDRI